VHGACVRALFGECMEALVALRALVFAHVVVDAAAQMPTQTARVVCNVRAGGRGGNALNTAMHSGHTNFDGDICKYHSSTGAAVCIHCVYNVCPHTLSTRR
jgi:hypothetical protein